MSKDQKCLKDHTYFVLRKAIIILKKQARYIEAFSMLLRTRLTSLIGSCEEKYYDHRNTFNISFTSLITIVYLLACPATI